MSTEMIWQTVSTNSAATEKLGELLGQVLKSPDAIELWSDLGGGKTTFVRGLAKGFGSRDIVSSPTFTLSKIYKAKVGREIHHFDFYRLSEPGVVADQLYESINSPQVVTVVEWSDIVRGALPKDHISIRFKPVDTSSEERIIEFHYPQSRTGIIKKVETAWQETRP